MLRRRWSLAAAGLVAALGVSGYIMARATPDLPEPGFIADRVGGGSISCTMVR